MTTLPGIQMSAGAIAQSVAYVGTRAKATAILVDVAHKYDVGIRDIISPSRRHVVSLARAEVCHRLRNEVTVFGKPMSYPQIGQIVQKDHASAIYAAKTWEDRHEKFMSTPPKRSHHRKIPIAYSSNALMG